MTVEEGYLEVPGGRVWYRSLTPEGGTASTPLLCLHGGPGFTHNYLEPLEMLAGRRRVVFYDQLGCGRSDRPDDLTLWTASSRSWPR
jgi:proline iminopeptidase